MAVPLDAIRAFHNAFRKDIKAIDTAADAAARGQANLDMAIKRYLFVTQLIKVAIGDDWPELTGRIPELVTGPNN